MRETILKTNISQWGIEATREKDHSSSQPLSSTGGGRDPLSQSTEARVADYTQFLSGGTKAKRASFYFGKSNMLRRMYPLRSEWQREAERKKEEEEEEAGGLFEQPKLRLHDSFPPSPVPSLCSPILAFTQVGLSPFSPILPIGMKNIAYEKSRSDRQSDALLLAIVQQAESSAARGARSAVVVVVVE